MAKRYRVSGEWIVEASSATDAENIIEDAIARLVDSAELEDCNAELEDLDEVDMD